MVVFFNRGCRVNATLSSVLEIDPIFNTSAFYKYDTCKQIAAMINEASSQVKLGRRRRLYHWTPEHVVKLRNFTGFKMWETNITALLIGVS